MNSRRTLAPAVISLAFALGPAAAVCPVADVYVDDNTCPGLGSGTAGDPYCRLQDAYTSALNGETILVAEGIYNECVIASNYPASDKAVTLIAEPWCNDAVRDNTKTVITGTQVCDGSGLTSDGSTLILGGNGTRLEGFTVSGGGASGIFAQGSVVITNNVVTGNTSTLGGGIYVYGAPCIYSGNIAVEVSNNRIFDNSADDTSTSGRGDGGGIYVLAENTAEFTACPNGETLVVIQGNTIEDNSVFNLDVATGGGVHAEARTIAGRSSRIVITQNVIRNNGAEPGSIAYGGGVWVGLFGTGSETIEIRDNTIDDNDATLDGGGVSAWMLPEIDGNHTLVVEGNVVFNNLAGRSGGGLDLFAYVDDLFPGNGVSLVASNNEIYDNAATVDGGGILASFTALRTAAGSGPLPVDEMTFRIENNRVTTNATSTGGGGGVFIQTLADADPDSFPPALCDLTQRAVVGIDFSGNLVAGNLAGGDGNFAGGGILAFLDSRGDAESRLTVRHSTIASNTIGSGFVGGVEVDALEEPDCEVLEVGESFLDIDQSIVSGNGGYGIGGQGAAGPGTAPTTDVTATFSDVFGNATGNYENSFFQNPSGGNVSVNPRLDPVSFAPAACSPVFGLGPSGAGFVADPDISGDGSVDGIDVIDLALSFDASSNDPTDPGDDDPRFDAAADLDRNGTVDGDDLVNLSAEFAEICP